MKEVENVAIPMHSNLKRPDVVPVAIGFNFETQSLMHRHTKLQLIRGWIYDFATRSPKPTLQPMAACA